MKLINKKTGEIVEFAGCTAKGMRLFLRFDDLNGLFKFEVSSLAELLNAGWEDYQEEETFWCISPTGTPIKSTTSIYDPLEIHLMKKIGNYFESEEGAEKVVEKRKAWKRLENKGFRFTGWATNEGIRGVDFEVPDSFFTEHNHSCISDETKNDLDLLFSQDDDDDDDYELTNAEINDLTDMGYGR